MVRAKKSKEPELETEDKEQKPKQVRKKAVKKVVNTEEVVKSEEVTQEPTPETVTEEVKPKKEKDSAVKPKRGRKSKAENVASGDVLRNENVILQLSINPINADATPGINFEKSFFKYEPTIEEPNAYDQYECNEFFSQPCSLKPDEDDFGVNNTTSMHSSFKSKKKVQPNTINFPGMPLTVEKPVEKKSQRIFEHLGEFIAREEWPISTNTVCFWCCHSFHNTPFGVPTKYVNGKFHVYGCFCSLECTTAYNFYSVEIKHDVWESYNLINLLARKIQYGDSVKIAPPRYVLKMFGGYMDIDDYRNHCKTSKIINTHTFPMVAMIQQLEEVNDNDQYSNRKNMYIPVDKQKLFLLENKVKLERTKPLFTNKNTLDHTMNLKIDDS